MIEAGAQTNAKQTTFHMKKKAVLMHRILMSFFQDNHIPVHRISMCSLLRQPVLNLVMVSDKPF